MRFPTTQDEINLVKSDRSEIACLRATVREQFLTFFVDESGGQSHLPGKIVPEHDKSVAFTGSTISTFKPLLLSGHIPEKGIFMVQNCLRTQNTNIIGDEQKKPQWSSMFSSIGGLAKYEEMDTFLSKTWKFLTEKLGIPEDRLRIRIASTDQDLMDSCKRNGLSAICELDANDPVYYTHKFGLPTVFGRNFNFALSDPQTGELCDIGNFIVIEDAGKPIGLEIAFGVETIVSRALGLPSPIHAAPITDFIEAKDNKTLKFADAVSAATTILQANIKPTASDIRGRTLRKYLQGAGDLRADAGLDGDQIRQVIEKFEMQEFGRISDASAKIVRYIESYEDFTRNGKALDGKKNAALSDIFSSAASVTDTRAPKFGSQPPTKKGPFHTP